MKKLILKSILTVLTLVSTLMGSSYACFNMQAQVGGLMQGSISPPMGGYSQGYSMLRPPYAMRPPYRMGHQYGIMGPTQQYFAPPSRPMSYITGLPTMPRPLNNPIYASPYYYQHNQGFYGYSYFGQQGGSGAFQMPNYSYNYNCFPQMMGTAAMYMKSMIDKPVAPIDHAPLFWREETSKPDTGCDKFYYYCPEDEKEYDQEKDKDKEETIDERPSPVIPDVPEDNIITTEPSNPSEQEVLKPEVVEIVVGIEKINEGGFLLPEWVPCRPNSSIPSKGDNPSLEGAFDLFLTWYQDCSALDIVIGDMPFDFNKFGSKKRNGNNDVVRHIEDRLGYIKSHPYLKVLQDKKEKGRFPGNSCQDILKQPPMFSYGGKPIIKNGIIDLFANKAAEPICTHNRVKCGTQPVSTIDCSGFIVTALRSRGLNLSPHNTSVQHVNTGKLARLIKDQNSCMEHVQFKKTGNHFDVMKAGDIMTVSQHHTFMFSKVGDDPLGIEQALKKGDCRAITPSHFNFEVIQSGAAGSLGVAQLKGNSIHLSSGMQATLLKWARQMCGQSLLSKGRDVIIKTEGQGRKKQTIIIGRHKGSKKEGCIDANPPKFKGKDCIGDCREGGQ